MVALDAATGDEVWKSYTIPDPPTLLRTYADGTQMCGAVGRRHLVGADDRREARRDLCRRGERVRRTAAADDGCDCWRSI